MKWKINRWLRNEDHTENHTKESDDNNDTVSLTDILVSAWNHLDAEIIAPYLADDIQYNSAWVSSTMSSKEEYLSYLHGKFKTIKESGNRPLADVIVEKGKRVPRLRQRDLGVESVLDFHSDEGKITRILMRPPMGFKPVGENEWGKYGQVYQEFLPKALQIAGSHIQKYISDNGISMPEFSWIQTQLLHPAFQHLCFRMGSQVYSILIAIHGFRSNNGQEDDNVVVFKREYDNLLTECQKHDLTPCIFPVAARPGVPMLEEPYLIHAMTGEYIRLERTTSEENVPMSEWEINSMGIQTVVNYLRQQNLKILSYCDVVGIEPQIWFEKNGKMSYVIVRSIPIGKRKIEFPVNNNLLLRLSDYDGYFADVQFSSSSPILKDENGNLVPLSKRDGDEDIWMWRGDGFYCNFTGLQEIERAIASNEFIKVYEKESYDIN